PLSRPPQTPPADDALDLVPAGEPDGLRLLQHHGRRAGAAPARQPAEDLARHPPQVPDLEPVDLAHHVADGDLAAVDLDLAAEVLELDHPALEVHEQARAQLVLGP